MVRKSDLYQVHLSATEKTIGYLCLNPCCVMVYEGQATMLRPFWNFDLRNATQVHIKCPKNIKFLINGEEKTGDIRMNSPLMSKLQFYSQSQCQCDLIIRVWEKQQSSSSDATKNEFVFQKKTNLHMQTACNLQKQLKNSSIMSQLSEKNQINLQTISETKKIQYQQKMIKEQSFEEELKDKNKFEKKILILNQTARLVQRSKKQLLDTIAKYYSSNYFHVVPRYSMLDFCNKLITLYQDVSGE